MALPRELRLTRSREIEIAREKGIRANGGPFLAFFWLSEEALSPLPPPRLCVVTSRRVGNAVVRNRARRLFRELFYKNFASLPAGTELVIVVRRSYVNHSFHDLEQRLLKTIRWWKKQKGLPFDPSC